MKSNWINSLTKMADAILELAEDKELRQEIAENGRKEAQKYTWEKTVDKVEIIRASGKGAMRLFLDDLKTGFEILRERGIQDFLSELTFYFSKRFDYLPFLFADFIYENDGEHIFSREWDFLFILDSCRFDEMKKADKPDGEMKSHISLGTATVDFLKENFIERNFDDDVVYITDHGYPQLYLPEEIEIIDLQEYLYSGQMKIEISYFKKILQRILEKRDFEDKKVIIHLVDPHLTKNESRELVQNQRDLPVDIMDRRDISPIRKFLTGRFSKRFTPGYPFLLYEKGYISKEKIKRYRMERLEKVMTMIDEIKDELDGKLVLTSDHGEAFGESSLSSFSVVEHPRKVRIDQLKKVPWYVVNGAN